MKGSADLISTFDFTIQTLFYQDDGGKWFRAESVSTGKGFALTPVDESLIKPQLQEMENGFTNRNAQLFARARQRKGHYIAVTRSAPATSSSTSGGPRSTGGASGSSSSSTSSS